MNTKKISIFVFLFFAISIISVLASIAFFYDRTAPNTYLLGKNYSGLNRHQIQSQIAKDFPLPDTLTVVDPSTSKTYTLNFSAISAAIDFYSTASKLLYRRFSDGFFAYFSYFYSPKNFSLQIGHDPVALASFTTALGSSTDLPFIDSQLVYDHSSKLVNVKIGQTGWQLDTTALSRDILSSLQDYSFTPVTLTYQTTGHLPSSDQIASAQKTASALIGKSLVLKSSVDPVTLDDRTLIGWINFDGQFQTTEIADYVSTLAKSLNRPPVDAIFKFENGRVLDFQPEVDGVTVKQDQLISGIAGKISELISSSAASVELTIPTTTSSPAVTIGDINELGIKQLLGRGSSTFTHSTAIRNYNIQKGASIVNHLLIPPGAEFSFIGNLGEVTLDTGFKKAYIIRQGKTELDVGGGICQVSTTLFRAALNTGLPITERQNHAYRVSYYEEDLPPGYDATVFIPKPDLRFVNDTPAHILIQSNYDDTARKLTYEIYGTSDGRQVEISNYRQWGHTPAPPDIYIDDPTLPAGKIVQDEKRIPGLKTAFDWTVTKDGLTLHQKTFTSNFIPWAAVYRRGPSQP